VFTQERLLQYEAYGLVIIYYPDRLHYFYAPYSSR
jgi:hypothetical protein